MYAGISEQKSSNKGKRVRTIFSAEQLERLEAEFARQQYMVGPERLLLAASLHLTESQVRPTSTPPPSKKKTKNKCRSLAQTRDFP